MLVLQEVDLVGCVTALVEALRCRSSTAARHSRSIDVMLAWGDLIRLASLVGSIGTSTHDTLANPVTPSRAGEAAVTTESASVATAHEMFRRQTNLDGAIRVDAGSITHRFDRSECLSTKTEYKSINK